MMETLARQMVGLQMMSSKFVNYRYLALLGSPEDWGDGGGQILYCHCISFSVTFHWCTPPFAFQLERPWRITRSRKA